jgi:hypothetical protein
MLPEVRGERFAGTTGAGGKTNDPVGETLPSPFADYKREGGKADKYK